MKKLILAMLLIISSINSNAQGYGQVLTFDPITGQLGMGWCILNTLNIYRQENADSTTNDFSKAWSFQLLDYHHYAGTPYSIVWADSFGYIKSSPITSLPGYKRRETYSGTTNASGVYTITYGTAYAAAPNVQFNIVGGAVTNTIRLTATSTTSATLYVQNRVDVLGLLPTYTNVSGASVDVLVTEK